MSVSTDVRYRLHSVLSLHWAGWNDEYVVFDESSGQTHQLDAVRAYVLHLLSDGRPQRYFDIAQELAALPAFPKEFADNDILTAIFSEFETCGLVEVIA